MSLLDDLKKKLTPENLQTVEDILGDDFDWDLVPRTRLNKVISQRNELKKQLNGGTPASSKGEGGSAKGGKAGDDDDVTYTQSEVEALLEKAKQQASKAATDVEIKYATLSKLREMGAIDPDIVYGLLDTSKLSLSDKGELVGFDTCGANELSKNKDYLFGGTEGSVPPGTGKNSKGSKSKDNAVDAAIANIFTGYGVSQVSEEE